MDILNCISEDTKINICHPKTIGIAQGNGNKDIYYKRFNFNEFIGEKLANKKKIKTKLDTNSDKTFIKIKEVVTNIIPLYIIFGNIIIMNKSLTICSDILLITWGIIFSLPKKNPLKILDKESNGNTKEIAKIGR